MQVIGLQRIFCSYWSLLHTGEDKHCVPAMSSAHAHSRADETPPTQNAAKTLAVVTRVRLAMSGAVTWSGAITWSSPYEKHLQLLLRQLTGVFYADDSYYPTCFATKTSPSSSYCSVQMYGSVIFQCDRLPTSKCHVSEGVGVLLAKSYVSEGVGYC